MDHQVILDVYVCASYNIHNFVQVDEGESGMSELLRNACKKHEAQNLYYKQINFRVLFTLRSCSISTKSENCVDLLFT